ncbi:hypothetical protein BBJ28_00011462 [Nothophytophthora sp. Chile5]|nr:hypothetical protein BBJ28_00011462 [Nothophytophthora sp. Chile5]
MNESASSSSLASSAAKPSTANSSSSPSSRKTRTIIVARSIPTGGGDSSTSSPKLSSTSAAVANQPHVRDTKSGKLAAYAALGGAEDVARFDQFLSEQQGHRSASELRAAAVSPQHMLASMKRKTMSNLHLEANSERPHGAKETEEDAVMQEQVQSEAKKRREEVVARRKWLSSLPIHERLAQQRQQNALRKWQQMNRDWETFKTRAAKRLGKPPQELVMNRASAYREQREMYDALQQARPLCDKVGGDIWLVSLRDEGTRYVPVGNIFSGLFCPIRESSRLGPRVRRPLDYQQTEGELEREIVKPLSKLEKRSLALLARKKWRLRKQLEVLQPHEVQGSKSSHLVVTTADLFAWAAGSTTASSGAESEGKDDIRTNSDRLNDSGSSRHRSLRSRSSLSSLRIGEEPELTEGFEGPSLRIELVADEEELLPDVEDGNQCKAPVECLPPLRLSFYTAVGEQQQHAVSVTNDGSTIVHFQWWRTSFNDETSDLTAHLRGRRTRKDEQELESHVSTSVSMPEGTLLPGETLQFVFTFESTAAGVFLEKWFLDTDPQPRIHYGTAPPDADINAADLPLEVRLSCTAADNFVPWKRRHKRQIQVEQQETSFMVALLVDEILDSLTIPEPVSFANLEPRNDATKFYDHNGAFKSEAFGDVYFSPDLVRDCQALYEQARLVLSSLSLENESVRHGEEESSGTNGGHDADAEQIATSTQLSPEQQVATERSDKRMVGQLDAEHGIVMINAVLEWDWRLETLRELCKAADAAQYTKMKRLTQELKREQEELEEEEEEEEEEKDEDGDESEAHDTEDGGNDGDREAGKLTRREQRVRARLTRRQALEDERNALQPRLLETFDTMRFVACTAPYSTARLQERLQERIGGLCGETPVVCEIAKATAAGSGVLAVRAATIESVRKLLMRAVDEAIGGDMDHQAQFEQERRRLQAMWLHDKLSYTSLPYWLTKAAASTVPTSSEVATSGNNDEDSKVKGASEPERAGVLLLHVDLDLSPWFSLVKTGKSVGSVPEAPVKVEQALSWRFSQDLLQHEVFVPAQIAQAVASLNAVLASLPTGNEAVYAVVLVSELGRPPLTKPMLKLLRNATQVELKAKTATETAEEDEEVGEKALEHSLQQLASQLSLKNVAHVMQRAAQRDIVFCSTVEEMQGQVDFARKERLLNSSALLDGNREEQKDTADAGVEISDEVEGGPAPRIFLLEHLDAVSCDLVTKSHRIPEPTASKPATPAPTAPPEHPKPAAGAGKKPVAAPASRKPSTPVTPVPVAPAPSPLAETPTREVTARAQEQQGMGVLRDHFARVFGSYVLDCLPGTSSESVYASGSFEDEQDEVHKPLLFVGPTLSKELEMWARLFQPTWPRSSPAGHGSLRVMTAIVGGRGLESKLRLIDSLLEVVDEIYFVGEVAMSLYRVLHAKQGPKQMQQGDLKPRTDDELDNEVAEINDGVAEEGTTEDGIPEEDNGDGEQNEAKKLDSTLPMGLWDLLAPAVEKLQQKASRKCVRLFLPVDWIVGASPLEDQESGAAAVEDGDDDEDEEEEEEEEEEDDGEEETKKKKRKASEAKLARQKPLVEPEEIDALELNKQSTYEGERAHVFLGHASSTSSTSSVGWRTFQSVTMQSLAHARVLDGKASVLTSLLPEGIDLEADDADEVEHSGDDGASQNSPPRARFEHEWTYRALDVGPIAMDALVDQLTLKSSSPSAPIEDPVTGAALPSERVIIVNGVCGAVEFREFSRATKQLLELLQKNRELSSAGGTSVLIAGNSTAHWLRRLEAEQLAILPKDQLANGNDTALKEPGPATDKSSADAAFKRPHKLVDSRVTRNAQALKQLLAAKPHPVLATLASSGSI